MNLSFRISFLLTILHWLIPANRCQDWSPSTIATSLLWIKDDQAGKRTENLKVIRVIKLTQWYILCFIITSQEYTCIQYFLKELKPNGGRGTSVEFMDHWDVLLWTRSLSFLLGEEGWIYKRRIKQWSLAPMTQLLHPRFGAVLPMMSYSGSIYVGSASINRCLSSWVWGQSCTLLFIPLTVSK